ncbi:hypothetical protein CEXT_661941 [Caerostris extrusa]|uniref:Uncharacterized protein n=1 Tax=Caerostris extrusa TaxID=172846 RepID=A0AAV4Y086_CAEEX|nr:hypothetical protein CEXT_661941 [Caerostris extrusa]
MDVKADTSVWKAHFQKCTCFNVHVHAEVFSYFLSRVFFDEQSYSQKQRVLHRIVFMHVNFRTEAFMLLISPKSYETRQNDQCEKLALM